MGEPAHKKAKSERGSLFSSESVDDEHPDKLCDQVSDAVLDICLKEDPNSKVACETAKKDNMVMVAGEITTQAKNDYEKFVQGVVAKNCSKCNPPFWRQNVLPPVLCPQCADFADAEEVN